MPLLQATTATSGDAAWTDAITADTTFSGLTTFTGGVIQNESAVIAGVTALTTAQSGALFAVTQPNLAPYAITLPATATSAGVWYTFILAVAANDGANITSDGVNMLGALVEGGAAVTAVLNTSVGFDGTGGVVGDHVTVRCDGTRWLVSGIGSNAASWVLG